MTTTIAAGDDLDTRTAHTLNALRDADQLLVDATRACRDEIARNAYARTNPARRRRPTLRNLGEMTLCVVALVADIGLTLALLHN